MQVISHHKNYFVEFGTNTLTYVKSKLPNWVVSRMHTPSLAQTLSQRTVLIAAIIGTTAAIILIANHFFKKTDQDLATPPGSPSDRPVSPSPDSPIPLSAPSSTTQERGSPDGQQQQSSVITPRSNASIQTDPEQLEEGAQPLGSQPSTPRSNESIDSESSDEEGEEEVEAGGSDASVRSRSSGGSSVQSDDQSMQADGETHGEGSPAAQPPIVHAMPPAQRDPRDLSRRRAGTIAAVVGAFALALLRAH